MKLILSSILVFLFVSTSAQEVKKKIITLEPQMSFQNYEHFKRLTLSSPDSPIEFLSGFEFDWGYNYQIKVNETKLNEMLSDGTQFEYEFVKIISKTKVQDSIQFRLVLDGKRYYYELDSSEQEMNTTLKPINDSTYVYMEEVEIEVTDKFRQKFETIVAGKTKSIGHFIFVNHKRIRLVKL
jgi:hypothetical protein